VLLAASDIVGPYEDAWVKLRELFGETLPRTVNMISGPSCTGDIGSTIVRGAHGPRRMCVVIVGGAGR
jgi:L-lactate dehydrogenase complex protein LldG